MMAEGRKLRSLLRFYKKNEIEIELKIDLKGGLVIKGTVIKLNCFFGRYLILKSKDNSLIKVFFENIIEDTIISIGFTEKEKKDNKDKTNRSPLPPKLRFDVLRRDKYVCQYCGACGPKVELEIDHIIPVARGGTDDMENLKTACFDCNKGKGVVVSYD